jgi:opacity protein-like surface antigen
MSRFSVLVVSILLAAASVAAPAQVLATATAHQVSITAGGMVSIFQTDYTGLLNPSSSGLSYYPAAQSSSQPLVGVGAYVDVKLTRWVQLEAEGRWQRFNQYSGISQDNYLIGPRLPVYHFWRSSVYAKALAGSSKMNFDSYGDNGTFTALAFGGGMDVKLTRRLSVRLVDVEYQYWPEWGNSSLSPYGASMGVGYRIF